MTVPHLSRRDPITLYRQIEQIYDRMRAVSEQGCYNVSVANLELVVYPGVYAPDCFTDSEWYAMQLPQIVGTRSLLEIGTGTGIAAIACALNGASVVATDLNPFAVANARENARRAGVPLDVRLGNVYEPLHPNERFDTIFWAHPFNNSPKPVHDMLMKSGFDYRYHAVKKYIREGFRHLTPGGQLLLGTGSTADLGMISCAGERANLKMRLLRQVELPLDVRGGPLITYFIYAFS